MKVLTSPKQADSRKKSLSSSEKRAEKRPVKEPNEEISDVDLNDFSDDFESSVSSTRKSAGKRSAGRSKQSTRRAKGQANSEKNNVSLDLGLKADLAESKKDSPKTEYDRLMHKAIYLLSMREHSVKELGDKLFSRSESPDVVFSVMDFLKENDYVSDSRFTEAFVRFKAGKGQGPIKIRALLRNKGVRVELIDEYLDFNAEIWFDNAQLLHQKKYGDEPLKDYNAWSKRARFLQGRGFSMEHIQSTVPQVDYD